MEKAIYKIHYLEWRNMKLFGLFGNRDKEDENGYYDRDLNRFEDLIYDNKEQTSQKSKARHESSIFDSEEEAKLDAQLNLHITDIELKKQYEKGLKEQYENAMKESESNKLEHINVSRFSKKDIEKYINSQCDILNETSRYIDQAKEEYSRVTSYSSDIQLIEAAPENIRRSMSKLAETISGLTVDRKISHTTESRLSNDIYFRMERIELEMPGALIQLQNRESYFQTVKKDLKILEGERASLRMDAKDLVRNQKQVKKVSMMSILGLFLIFGIFIVSSLVIGDENNSLFLIVIGLSALFSVGLFAYLKNTERQVILIEIKLNKATNLLNKVKIKYINSANTIDYEYAKYGVKSSYQLSNQYEAYLEGKKQKLKISRLTDELNDAEVSLGKILKELRLYDSHIWLAQVKALIDAKEMLEVKQGLSMRRQKLRTQIEYNMNQLNEVKKDIKRVTINNPEYTDEVLKMIENYENKSVF